jgi:hypothetical protein
MTKHLMRAALHRALPGSLLLARNGLALIGLTVSIAAILMFTAQFLGQSAAADRGIVFRAGEQSGFLLARFARSTDSVTGGAAVPLETPEAQAQPAPEETFGREQVDVARYLARKYHLSSEAMELMVREAYKTGHESGVEPSLLLAVIAVESGFNPFAQSSVGAEGLMQVMTKVHGDKIDGTAGPLAVLDPAANIRVGAVILKDCVRRGGSLRDGLRLYVGSSTDDDGGYGARVLQERERIQLAGRGGNPFLVPVVAVKSPPASPVSAPSPSEEVAPRLEPTAERASSEPTSL